MPLMEHIRELRNRLFKAAFAVLIGAIIGWFLYPHVWSFMERPYCRLNLTPLTATGHHQGCQEKDKKKAKQINVIFMKKKRRIKT